MLPVLSLSLSLNLFSLFFSLSLSLLPFFSYFLSLAFSAGSLLFLDELTPHSRRPTGLLCLLSPRFATQLNEAPLYSSHSSGKNPEGDLLLAHFVSGVNP